MERGRERHTGAGELGEKSAPMAGRWVRTVTGEEDADSDPHNPGLAQPL